MAVAGKKPYQIYLDPENTEYVKSFLETTRFKGGFSAFMDTYLRSVAKTLKAAKYVEGKKLTVAQMFKIGVKGLTQKA